MIQITDTLAIDENEIEQEAVHSSGPGGQNVNKTSTAVKLRFDVVHSPSLPTEVRQRLLRLAGRRATKEGVLVIDARRHRTQELNRQDAMDRLVRLIQRAAEEPKSRRKTRPTLASRQQRREAKRHRSEVKRLRRSVPPSPDS
jgi:ribosome-associated protein